MRAALLDQAREARRLIDRHDPDRLVVLGGDCLVNLAPVAYPSEFGNAHVMVLGDLLGQGDADFAGMGAEKVFDGEDPAVVTDRDPFEAPASACLNPIASVAARPDTLIRRNCDAAARNMTSFSYIVPNMRSPDVSDVSPGPHVQFLARMRLLKSGYRPSV